MQPIPDGAVVTDVTYGSKSPLRLRYGYEMLGKEPFRVEIVEEYNDPVAQIERVKYLRSNMEHYDGTAGRASVGG